MAATLQISVTNVADTAIIVASYCRKIVIRENAGIVGWPTTGFLLKKPYNLSIDSTVPFQMNLGEQYQFSYQNSSFVPGQIIGYLRTVSGTTTVDQDET